jgi:anti-sigma B factor antagonist
MNQGNACRVAIAGEMTIYRAMELKDLLLDPFAVCGDVEVDLSGVEEIDTAGVQLLVLCKREATAHNKSLRLVGHSQVVLDALDLCDLGSYFGDPVVIQSQDKEAA